MIYIGKLSPMINKNKHKEMCILFCYLLLVLLIVHFRMIDWCHYLIYDLIDCAIDWFMNRDDLSVLLVYVFIHSFVRPSVRSFVRSSVRSFIHLLPLFFVRCIRITYLCRGAANRKVTCFDVYSFICKNIIL